jgi:hypothetical protein
MPQQGMRERIAQSRVTGLFMSRPRMAAALVALVALVAVQGGAAAGDGIVFGSDGSCTTCTGPDPDE